ncbi:MAG: hypothetical protein U0350_22615 [Caldilineaceae bacterium]
MLDHTQLKELLAFYADLSQAERQVVDAHLEQCAECSAQLRVYQQLGRTLNHLVQDEVAYGAKQMRMKGQSSTNASLRALRQRSNGVSLAHVPWLVRPFPLFQLGVSAGLLLLLVWLLALVIGYTSPQVGVAAKPPVMVTQIYNETMMLDRKATLPAKAAGQMNGSFGYGIEAQMVDNHQAEQVMRMVSDMGFSWVKQKISWKRFEQDKPGQIDWVSMTEIITAANRSGIDILFTVVNAPDWAREPHFDSSVEGPPVDPQTYAHFAGAVAKHFCGSALKAIEVWNEQNMHYAWGKRPLNPQDYIALLAPAYTAIKAACPTMYVISGASTPAGHNPDWAYDDEVYLYNMLAAGLANYADAIGANPTGYNVPPDVTWQGACAAIQRTGNMFNGPCDSPHHSWSFRSTLEDYWKMLQENGAGNKKIWVTQFGWAAGPARHNNYAFANDNDPNEQAQWTVKAYQMMKAWGFVGPAFLSNLNFKITSPDDDLALWGIVTQDWRPLPAYSALKEMAK